MERFVEDRLLEVNGEKLWSLGQGRLEALKPAYSPNSIKKAIVSWALKSSR